MVIPAICPLPYLDKTVRLMSFGDKYKNGNITHKRCVHNSFNVVVAKTTNDGVIDMLMLYRHMSDPLGYVLFI